MPSALALCSEHPDAPATTPCSRCGGFVCDACCTAQAAPFRCSSCTARLPDASLLGAEPLSFASCLALSVRFLRGGGRPVVTLLTAVAIPEALIQSLISGPNILKLPLGWTLPLILLNLGINGAVLLLVRARALGEVLSPTQALRRAFGRWWAMFTALFEAGLTTMFFLMLGIVPGLVKIGQYAVVVPVTLLEEGNPTARSTELAKGRRLLVFGLVTTTWLVRMLIVFSSALIARRGLVAVAGSAWAKVLIHLALRLLLGLSESIGVVVALAIYLGLRAAEAVAPSPS